MKKIKQEFDKYCRENNIEKVKEILNSKEFLEDSSIDYNYSSGIYEAADYNKLDMVKFLLDECELKKYANINYENNAILKTACRQNYFEIVNYLIIEYQMKLTLDVLTPTYENCNYVMELYQKRNLNNNLERNLSNHNSSQKEELNTPAKKLKI